MRRIISLCDYSGNWVRPYQEAGYDVMQVDLKFGQDVRLLKYQDDVYGVLAAPPCDHLAVSGARWWANKGQSALLEGLAIVDACLRFITVTQPKFWVLENPVGRLVHYLGKPQLIFNPCDYGDGYTKKTCLWGKFNIPDKKPVLITEPGKIHRMPPSTERKTLRSLTPMGFARAFFEANQ